MEYINRKWYYFNETSFTSDLPVEQELTIIDHCTALSCEQSNSKNSKAILKIAKVIGIETFFILNERQSNYNLDVKRYT